MLTPISFPYGDGALTANIPERNLMGIVRPNEAAMERRDEAKILRAALDHPVGSLPLRQLAHKGQRVCIVTSDITRPCPSARLLPAVLGELAAAGVPDEDIVIVIGLGLHRLMTEAEIDQIVGPEVRRHIRVLNHDINDVVRLGVTSRDTPVEFFRAVVEADFRICLGNLEFHWFAGYSGGAKAVLPGVASRPAILANHGLMTHPGVGSGQLEGNPLRMDIEEAVDRLGVDFILNVVVDGEHHILEAVAGDVTAAHRRGCDYIAQRGMTPMKRQADIVIASAGGFPKDINMNQAHKGMEHASYFVRDGGVLILAAECRESWGHKVFEDWMKAATSPQEIVDRIQREFQFGGHKAAGIARIACRISVFVVSAMPDEEIRRMFLVPFHSLDEALKAAFETVGADSQMVALPYAGSIIPTRS
jgi:nickel-dependent lactate racemase